MTSRASCIRSRACTSSAASAPGAGDRLDVGDGQVGAGQDDRRARPRRTTVRVEVRDLRLTHRPRIVGYAAAAPTQTTTRSACSPSSTRSSSRSSTACTAPSATSACMLAMAIESAMVPLPSELILPYAGFLVSDPSQIEPLTGQPWNFWIVVDRGDHRQHARVARRLRHRRVRRPAVPRALRQVPADPPARDRAGRLVLRPARRGDRLHRPAAADRPDLHQLPGRRGPDADRRPFIVYSTAGAFIWSCLLVYAGTVLGANWERDPPRAPAVRPGHRGRRRAGGRAVHLVAARDAGPAGPSASRATTTPAA